MRKFLFLWFFGIFLSFAFSALPAHAQYKYCVISKASACLMKCPKGGSDDWACSNSCHDRYNGDNSCAILTENLCNDYRRSLADLCDDIGPNSSETLSECRSRRDKAVSECFAGIPQAPKRQPIYTPPPQPTYTPSTNNNSSEELSSALEGLFGKKIDDPKQSEDFLERATQCQQRGGTMLDGACTDEFQTSETKTEDDIRKKLGTDLETMKAVSDLGARNALKCTGLQRNSGGWLEVHNLCGQPINYGYCYSEWVPKRELNNPFKCDLTGKPSWSGASSVGASATRQFPSQGDSKSMRANFGPCMAKVIFDDRTYSYLHSRRTTTGPFNGMGGKYKCIYQKTSG